MSRGVIATEMLRAGPPVMAAGYTLNEVVIVATLAFIALQSLFILYKWRNDWADRRAKKHGIRRKVDKESESRDGSSDS